MNIVAGKNGIGRVDLVEYDLSELNQEGFMKLRVTLLIIAHRAIESITLDKKTMHEKDEIMPKYAELIYNGFWYSKS